MSASADGTLSALPEYTRMMTAQEHEVACVAHFMGYELMRGRHGYVLIRKLGAQREVVKAVTLEEITKLLKH